MSYVHRDHRTGMLLLTNCLADFSKTKGELSQLSVRQQWLLELLGHTRSLVTGAMPLADTAPSKDVVKKLYIEFVSLFVPVFMSATLSASHLNSFLTNYFKK